MLYTQQNFMNKQALIKAIAQECDKSNFKINNEQCIIILESFIGVIINQLKQDITVNIVGFGKFLTRTRHARGGVNPQNPTERIQIPEVRVAKFVTGKRLKDELKK